jgi:hypothetical protein
MPLPPSRRDTIGPPKRNVSDLAALVRHNTSWLRSIDPGILGGRFATPRPVPSGTPQLVGDDSGADGLDNPWEWGDRLTVTGGGQQTFTLTYEPVPESLVIRWHPNGRAPIIQIDERWSLSGQIVTIPDPGGDIAVGDVFSAQYQYLPQEADSFDPATVLLRGESHNSGGNGPGLSNLALPLGTQPGDLLFLEGGGNTGALFTVTDSRLTQISPGVWIGWVTSADPIGVSAVGAFGNFWSVAAATFSTNASGWGTPAASTVTSVTDGSSVAIPQISGIGAALCGIRDNHDTVAGVVDTPTGWTFAGQSSSAIDQSLVASWDNGGAAGTSPAGPTFFHGGTGTVVVTVVPLIGPSTV